MFITTTISGPRRSGKTSELEKLFKLHREEDGVFLFSCNSSLKESKKYFYKDSFRGKSVKRVFVDMDDQTTTQIVEFFGHYFPHTLRAIYVVEN